MTPITHHQYDATIAQELARIATSNGLEVSDDPHYEVKCDYLAIPDTDLTLFALRFPEEVVSCGPTSGTSTVVEYNEGQSDVALCINQTAYGIDMKYVGLPDHPYMSLFLFVRQYTPDPVDDDEDDGESYLREMEAFAGARFAGASVSDALDEAGYASGRLRAPTKADYHSKYSDPDYDEYYDD